MIRFSCRLLLCFLLASCVTMESRPTTEPASTVASIAVLPVEILASEQIPGRAKKELAVGQTRVEALLAEYFAPLKTPKVHFVHRNTVEGLLGPGSGSRQRQAMTIGRQLGADAVLLLELSRYRQRQGTPYSVVSPAAFGFHYSLVRVADGMVLCSGTFDQQQQAAFENIFAFSFKRGLRWLPVEDFARQALWEKLAQCPLLEVPQTEERQSWLLSTTSDQPESP